MVSPGDQHDQQQRGPAAATHLDLATLSRRARQVGQQFALQVLACREVLRLVEPAIAEVGFQLGELRLDYLGIDGVQVGAPVSSDCAAAQAM